ncbi:MAG: hypothetical protein ABI323_04585 [Solirubrobacteraceae bacterium]
MGSSGSVLSFGSIGSAASLFSIGSGLPVASILCFGTRRTIMGTGSGRPGRDRADPESGPGAEGENSRR